MQIRVSESNDGRQTTSTKPVDMTLPWSQQVNKNRAKETRHMTMSMTMDDHGLEKHLLNGWGCDNETIVKPQLGTTEIWELENKTHHTHPIHLHLVEFRVLGRGPNGTDDPNPNERGEKMSFVLTLTRQYGLQSNLVTSLDSSHGTATS